MTNHFLSKKWFFATILAVLVLILAIRIRGPWEKLLASWELSPVPYHFESLKGCSDGEIALFMGGAKEVDSFLEAGAPDSNFPEQLWNTDPKSAALAFAEANRGPTHRTNFQIWVDSNAALIAPNAGWLILDDFYNQTVLRFGGDQPFLFQATTSSIGRVSNRYVDSEKHDLQLIPLSPDEARFLAGTAFWLGHFKSLPTHKDYHASQMWSSHGSSGTLEWQIDRLPPHCIQGALWDSWPISKGWQGDYDDEAELNLTTFLFTQALPQFLGKRWEQPTRIPYDFYQQPLAERLKPHDDTASQAKLTQVILAALARHEADPWPAKALVALAQCAGDTGLSATLPALEMLAAKLPPPSADETEFTVFDAEFRYSYATPKDPDERKQWERHKSLKTALEYDFVTQVRRALTQAIRQLHVLGQTALLHELAQSNDHLAMWALQQLYRLEPNAYAEALIHRFSTVDIGSRRFIFETLATLDPAATRRLRKSLSEKEQIDLELIDDPSRAQSRIPALLEIIENPANKNLVENGYPIASKRGPAIQQLAKLPLNPAEQNRFEKLLLNELLYPETNETIGKCAISAAAIAVRTLPNPDRFWDALYQATSVETGSSEFNALLDALANLAIAKPEQRLLQLTELLRPRLRSHNLRVDTVCRVALALDLRGLAPEIEHFATSSPTVPDGESTSSCDNAPDNPCLHRYHSARHLSALWQETDPDTLARMWTALLQNSPYDFTGTETIPTCLRDRFRAAISAASQEISSHLVAKARATTDLPSEISNWLASLP